jgi:hypothetical protein
MVFFQFHVSQSHTQDMRESRAAPEGVHSGDSLCCCSSYYQSVAFDTVVVADGDYSAVNEGYTGTFASTGRVDKKHHGNKNLMLNFYKTIV